MAAVVAIEVPDGQHRPGETHPFYSLEYLHIINHSGMTPGIRSPLHCTRSLALPRSMGII